MVFFTWWDSQNKVSVALRALVVGINPGLFLWKLEQRALGTKALPPPDLIYVASITGLCPTGHKLKKGDLQWDSHRPSQNRSSAGPSAYPQDQSSRLQMDSLPSKLQIFQAEKVRQLRSSSSSNSGPQDSDPREILSWMPNFSKYPTTLNSVSTADLEPHTLCLDDSQVVSTEHPSCSPISTSWHVLMDLHIVIVL